MSQGFDWIKVLLLRLLVCTMLASALVACGSSGGDSDDEMSESDDMDEEEEDNNNPPNPTTADLVALGEKLFNDTNFSNPPGLSCASCHTEGNSFSEPDDHFPVSEGAVANRFGKRNSPTATYARFIPPFSRVNDPTDMNVPPRQIPRGGLFVDGRSATLELQAQQPFLNTLEMNMADKAAVVAVLSNADYVDDFLDAYGDDILDDVDEAYEKISEAIASFERDDDLFAPFSSKFDAVKAGSEIFSTAEASGEAVFIAANCGRCHTNNGASPLFTNFDHENIGVPSNPSNPFLMLDSSLNPDGAAFIDLGLGAVTGQTGDDGKFRTPTLRNIENTGPYMHNGVFDTLEEVVDFYNSRNPADAEVTANVTNVDIGGLGLTPDERNDLVAFMKTLTDGYQP